MCEKCKMVKRLAKKTAEKIKEIEKDNKDNGKKKPVDIDMIKTIKAMFYEKTVEILSKGENQDV